MDSPRGNLKSLLGLEMPEFLNSKCSLRDLSDFPGQFWYVRHWIRSKSVERRITKKSCTSHIRPPAPCVSGDIRCSMLPGFDVGSDVCWNSDSQSEL